jgi:hypothetical protein
MLKVGDQLTIDGKLVEVTYVMNENTFGYKPAVAKAEVFTQEEVKEDVPKRTRRKKV